MMPRSRPLAGAAFVVTALALAIAATECTPSGARSEGLEPSTLPTEVRADYAVFAQRCSKCHSLARPLNSGISDENYWAMYVARMRRQPGSGISPDDAPRILRFLHFYSLDQLRKREPVPAASSEAAPDSGAP
jgi:hypothetical protein